MNFFVDYIQPLTVWLQANPHWSLFFTFLISLAESLAIVGSIVPGSITMTAIGIMAGSGIMRIDLTLIAAVLGAVTGDGLSYALGYYYSDQLTYMWPFKKYPSWLKYGKEFFERHGGKSVFLGRFVGPLRSIIPVIAGIMHMKQWRFFIANFFSAIGWSILYVMPGVLIGAASHELSAESATRLILLIFVVLVAVWLLSIVIKWVLTRVAAYLKTNLHQLWVSLKKHPSLFKLVNTVTPANEENHYTTVALVLFTLFNIICFISFIVLTLVAHQITQINTPIHLLMESLHTDLLEAFFIVCTQLTSTLTLILLLITASFWFIRQNNSRAIIYSISIVVISIITTYAFKHIVYIPRPPGLLVTMPGSSFLAMHLVTATAFLIFLLFYIRTRYSLLTNTLRSFTLMVLFLSGLGSLYLGDYWLTDILASYFTGASIGLAHCLAYRKMSDVQARRMRTAPMLITLLVIIIGATTVSTYLNFKRLIHNHTQYHEEFTLDETKWWNQRSPLLPLYRFNRVGKRISLLNIQFSGDLDALENSLIENGWLTHSETLFTNIIARLNNDDDTVKLPLFAQLFENKRPELMMTYRDKNSNSVFELRLWESNYYLTGINKPIWIGSIHLNKPDSKSLKYPANISKSITTLTYLLPSLNGFSVRRIELPKTRQQKIVLPAAPYILLIK